MSIKSKNGFITETKTMINGKMKNSYSIWFAMIQRCYNPNNKGYKTYGGKGIFIDEKWKRFSEFEKWYNENYIEGYHIDKDLSGLGYYGPDSCVFISQKENNIEACSRKDSRKHYKSVGIRFYETKPVLRSQFKRTCKRMRWNFDDFEETYSGEKDKWNGKKYYYKLNYQEERK